MPVFQTDNLIGHFGAHFLKSDRSVSMAFVVILSSLALHFFHRSSSSCYTARRIRNSALHVTASLSSGCMTASVTTCRRGAGTHRGRFECTHGKRLERTHGRGVGGGQRDTPTPTPTYTNTHALHINNTQH